MVKITQKSILGPANGFDVTKKAGTLPKIGLKMGLNEPLLRPIHAVVGY